MKNKIKLDLFKLKTKQDLESVQQFFTASLSRFFDSNQRPRNKFFRTVACPLCESKLSKKTFEIDGFCYFECLHCKSLYVNPQLRDDVLEELYDSGPYQVYQDKLVKPGREIRAHILEERKYSQIDSLLDEGSIPMLLDVGCGGGTFLNVCKRHGWYVEGVDLSLESLLSAMENYQIITHHGNFSQIKFDKRFDVITLWGVLEHVPNPVSIIEKAKKLLNKGGVIAFEVPSSDCFLKEYLKKYNLPSPTRYIESGRHNIFFSKGAIERIAQDVGLEVELIETNGLDIQTILMAEFDEEITDKILNIQDILNDLLLGDHYRVFLK